MFHFSLRDLFWLTLLVALGLTWYLQNDRRNDQTAKLNDLLAAERAETNLARSQILAAENKALTFEYAYRTKLGKMSLGRTPLGAEGALGLQRAFQMAGARTTVTSLWKVDDTATQVLMTEFYRNLWEKKLGKLEALRQAQLMMLRRYDSVGRRLRGLQDADEQPQGAVANSPYFWAAFVLSGDWR